MRRKLDAVLPHLGLFLEEIETISNEFPVCCVESSIILHAWLKRNGIESVIKAGFYPDPVLCAETIHFWVAVEGYIIDGTAIQFRLSSYSGLPKTCAQLRTQIGKTAFVFAENCKNYKKCVNAYMAPELNAVIDELADCVGEEFHEFMEHAREVWEKRARCVEETQYMLYSTTYKLERTFYNATLGQVIEMFRVKKKEAGAYIKEYN